MMILCIALLLPAAEPAAPPPSFTVFRADGTSVTGTLRDIAANWSVTLGGKTPVSVEGSELLSLRRTNQRLPAFPPEAQVLFVNGDRLAGQVDDIAKERVAFSSSSGGAALSLPLSAVSVLWFADPAGEADPALLRRRLLTAPRRRDAVWLRNGDVVEGTLTSLDKDGVHVDVERKEVVVERNKLAYIALNTELARTLRPKGTYARLTLKDGSRLGLSAAQSDGTTLTGRTLFNASISVPLADVVAFDVRQGKVVYLSDLKPHAYKHTPWSAGLEWPYVADGSVGGQDLRLGGGTFDNGLGMHCKSEITYKLDGAYRRFEALVGLDDHEGQGGNVRIRVLVDGKPRDIGWNKDLTAADGPQAVRVNVTAAQELTLIVDRGRGGWWDQQGHVNWVDARLVK
jgi:hypothetical protein